MYLDEFLSTFWEFESAHGGRQALDDLRVITFVNGKREHFRVSVEMSKAHGVIIGGERIVIENYEGKSADIRLRLIRLGQPPETTWKELWDSIERGWADTYISRKNKKKASRVMPVNVYVCSDRDVYLYQVYETREPLRPLDGIEVRMGEDGIELDFSYNRIRRRETIQVY